MLTSSSAAAEPRECARTADCDRGERCVRRACVPERRGGTGDTCEADADCDDGLSCERSACRRSTDARTRGAGVELTTQLDSEALRQAWIRRGGAIVSYEVRGQVTGIVGTSQTLDVTQPCVSGTSVVTKRGSVEGRSGGVGGGLGARIGVVGLSPPDGATWLAFRAGTGFDASMTSFRTLTGGTFSGPCSDRQAAAEPTFQTSSTTILSVPFGAGVLLGLGSGKDARWRGAVLGIAYVPSFTYIKPSEGEGTGRLSYLGFEATLDVTTLEAAIDKVAAAAHLRLFAFVVPPVKEDWPWVISAGGGAVWY